MWPQIIQFETRQIEAEAQLRLYGEREAAAQAELMEARVAAGTRRPGWRARLFGARHAAARPVLCTRGAHGHVEHRDAR